MAIGVAPGFAAERNAESFTDGSRNFDYQCDNVLGSKDGQGSAHIRYCENRH